MPQTPSNRPAHPKQGISPTPSKAAEAVPPQPVSSSSSGVHTEGKIHPVILIMADISGYTQFMFSNQMELVHSQWVISQLLNSIIAEIEIPLEVAKLEGDAVFLYARTDQSSMSSEAIVAAIRNKLPQFFDAFSHKLLEMNQGNTCACHACENISELRLKLIVHSGEALFYQIGKFDELSGADVILLHRLMKNSVEAREYILLTEPAWLQFNLQDSLLAEKHEEVYTGIGKITTFVHRQNQVEQELSHARELRPWELLRSQLKLWAQRHFHLFIRDWSRKSLLELPRTLQWPLYLFQGTLALVLLIGGIRIGFPANAEDLANSYINPTSGFIGPIFVPVITETLGVSVATFLRIQGWLEIGMALMLLRGGINVKVVGIMGAMMFWMFAVANPIAGEIRLSRDVALAGLCIALALTGPQGWSVDGEFKNRHVVLLLVRLSLAYTLAVSGLFTEGVFANAFNTTLPPSMVFWIGVVLGLGLFPRWVMAGIGVWISILIGWSLFKSGLLWGLEDMKREVGLWGGAVLYALLGPDRWAWPKPRQQTDLGKPEPSPK